MDGVPSIISRDSRERGKKPKTNKTFKVRREDEK